MRVVLLIYLVFCNLIVFAKDDNHSDSSAIVTNSFWDNWYGQVGVDMNLLFPSHHSIKGVFPNGKSFGVDVSVGKWFSPEFGGRFKVVWNNGILPNNHNTWLAPYGIPGENHRHGGFLNFIWDVQVNMHNLLGQYKPYRKWDLIVAPRAGGWWDNYADKGCPILGIGIINSYRLTNKWSLYVDAGYHFVASINGVESGTDHGGNSFAEIKMPGDRFCFNLQIKENLSPWHAWHGETMFETAIRSFKYYDRKGPMVSKNGCLMLFIGGFKAASDYRDEIYGFLNS